VSFNSEFELNRPGFLVGPQKKIWRTEVWRTWINKLFSCTSKTVREDIIEINFVPYFGVGNSFIIFFSRHLRTLFVYDASSQSWRPLYLLHDFENEDSKDRSDPGGRIHKSLINSQLDALFHVFIYFMSLHVSGFTALIISRSNCINTSSGMVSLCKWLLGMPDRHTKQSLTQTNHTRWC